ncbi:MAG: [ribosomal protein S18]-alanine N-acetyltransferase [Clostridiales bacterium]|nr:[ribosomal protein S18]-alanine N-acetyltransferase [Clostridiales bacterium]
MEYIIRPITSADIDAVWDIEKMCFSVPWSRQSFVLEVEKNRCARYVVAEHSGAVVGYGGMWLIVDEAHITNIAVHPLFRRKGIGEAILKALVTEAHRMGIDRMTLEVRASNIAAQSLYKKLGFVEVGVRKGYYSDNNEDAIIMWNFSISRTLGLIRGE